MVRKLGGVAFTVDDSCIQFFSLLESSVAYYDKYGPGSALKHIREVAVTRVLPHLRPIVVSQAKGLKKNFGTDVLDAGRTAVYTQETHFPDLLIDC